MDIFTAVLITIAILVILVRLQEGINASIREDEESEDSNEPIH